MGNTRGQNKRVDSLFAPYQHGRIIDNDVYVLELEHAGTCRYTQEHAGTRRYMHNLVLRLCDVG